MNFGVCTPSPTDAAKCSQSLGRSTVHRCQQGPCTPAASYSNNAQMPTAMDLTGDRLMYSDPQSRSFQGGSSHNTEENASGEPRDDHGSVDDIDHFFISADDWDRSHHTGATRFYEEHNRAEEEDYIYDNASSASMVMGTAYSDNSIKGIYPFLSTPTPTTPAPQSPQVQTSPAPTERTSSLPLPSAQVNFYCNARLSNGTIDSVRAVGATDAKININDCGHRLQDEMTYRAVSNHHGPYMCRPDANEKGIPDFGNQPLHQSANATNDPVSASVGKKGPKEKLSKPLHDTHQDRDLKTGVKSKSKKARSGSADHLFADPSTGSSRDSNLGPLESFLSSNYFIKDGLHDLTGPFFLQQSFHCHAKAPSLKELMSGIAAIASTTGVGSDASGLTTNGKKRYRKHPASISASKIKNEAQHTSQHGEKARMGQYSQTSAPAHATDADRHQPDDDMNLSSIRDRGALRVSDNLHRIQITK
jgi:hypothetical protein